MLTGTPLDMTPFGLQGIGTLYWVLVAVVLAVVATKVKGQRLKILSIVVVLAILVSPVVLYVAGGYQAKARANAAKARFDMLCKKSGEKIYKTVDNVEGIFLMKLRPEKANFSDQFALDDPYGRDLGGKEGYIESFIRGEFKATHTGAPVLGSPARKGYHFVEAVNLEDGKRYRYTGGIKEVTHTSSMMIGGDGKTTFKTKDFVLDKVLAVGDVPRYGVTYEDISTREDREYWIAGSFLKVIDLQTNEVMAERVGYMMDFGQGDTSGERSPWLFAADHACPAFAHRNGASAQAYQALDVVEKVLKPKTD
jgi:hypothetical protein